MAAGAATVRVKGLKEVDRAFRKCDKDASKELRAALVEVARPVADGFRVKLGRYRGSSPGTVRPRALANGARVTQGAKKVTGLRGDFGLLQQRLLEATLADNAEQIYKGAEKAIDELGVRNGF